MSLRSLAKKVIDYTIEDEYKVYRLKKTPFAYRRKYTQEYHEKYDALPIRSNKVVISNYMGSGYGCNGKYVLEYLLKNEPEFAKELDLVWVVRDAEKNKECFPPQVRLVEYGSFQAMQEYATARVWLQNFQMVHYLNKGLLKRDGQVYIQMWHGSLGIKKIEGAVDYLNRDKAWLSLAKKNAAYTDYWISNSDFETKVYREAFWGAGTILEYGHPRNDIFYADRSEAVRKIRETYGILQNQKLLLYVPTFRDGAKGNKKLPDGVKIADSLNKRFGGDWVLAIRQHPRIAADGKLENDAGQNVWRNVTFYPDIQELLAAADVVLTDYSSAIFDFVLTGRPGFLLMEDYKEYEDLRGLYYSPHESPFPVSYTQEQLCEKITGFNEEQYQQKVQAFLREKGCREDGNAAERVTQLIKEIIVGRLEVQDD
ncbi:MAG: CDP-glycerol glycerophosphotransferase family protein [Lachnospiraceae bacterium]|nr:CDP-glycerol glycerophosphotransferase family protein [Lachnospiraceae bacterium]